MKELLKRCGARVWDATFTAIEFLRRIADCRRAKIIFRRGSQECYGEIWDRVGDHYRVKLCSIDHHLVLGSQRGGFFATVPVGSPGIQRIWRWR